MNARRWLWFLVAGSAGVAGAAAQVPDPPDPGDASGQDGPSFVEVEAGGFEDGDAMEFPPGLDPNIAIDPLNPRLDPEQPWIIASDGRVIPQRRPARPPTPVFKAPLTDAFSAHGGDGIELTFGGQTALGGTLGVRVARLEVIPPAVELTVGESLALNELAVRAFDGSGELVQRAPLRLEIEGPEGFVDMAAFERDKTTLAGLARGIGRIWITSLLPTRQAEPFSIPVILIVREPDSPGVRMSWRVQENVPESPLR